MLFTSGLSVPEGPVLLSDGSFLCVEMGPDRGCVTHISADGQSKRIIAKTGRPNGLAVDKEGIIWVAESMTPLPCLIRMTMDGETEVFLTECDGEPFLFPNDLAFGPDGALYMTDSGITFEDFAPGGKIRPDWETVPVDGRVYKIDVQTKEITKLDSGIRFTNGIAFDPDDNLYSNETLTGMVYRYEWKDGEVGPREGFGNVNNPDTDPEGPEGFRGPDGMKFSTNGHLYVTVAFQSDGTVLGPDGAVVERIKTNGNFPTNLCFGPPGSKKIYVTEDAKGTMEIFDVDTDGLPLYAGEVKK
jgi:gluconolactonase